MPPEDDPLEDQEAEIRQWFAKKDARIAALETAIRKHRDQKGDDRCWVDDLELYALLGEGEEQKAELTLPPREEFLQSCERFWQQRQTHAAPAPQCMTIRQLQDERARLVQSLAETHSLLHSTTAAELRAKGETNRLSATLQSILDFQPDPRHVLGWNEAQQRATFAEREARRALNPKG